MKSSILKNKNFKIIEICFICIVILIFGSGLIFRHTILSSVINKKIRNFNQKFHAQLNIKDFEFTGLTEINFNNISLAPNNGDTLMKIDSLNAQISFWRLLVFNISLNKLEIKNIDFHFVRHDSLTNYMFLFEKNKDSLENINKQQTINYAERVQSLFETIFHSIPSTVRFTNVNISADLNNKKFSFYTKQFVIEDKLFETIIKLNNEDQITEWILKGRLDASDHSAQFKLFASDHKRIIIPYIDQKWNAHIGFDTLQFSLKNIEEDYNLISFNGSLSLDNFIINQPRIGQEDVFFKHGHIDYKINITKDYLEIDSASHFVFNKLPIQCAGFF